MPRKNLLDRFDDFFETWYDRLVGRSRATDPPETPPVMYKWWFVANRVTAGMVITDHARCIVIAPVAWNRFIGMTLDVLLGQVHARAVLIPGPHPDAHWAEEQRRAGAGSGVGSAGSLGSGL
jgi:hypothetical protein